MVYMHARRFRPLSDLNLIDNFLFHKMIDAANLRRGQTYKRLPNVVIIFILPYDPFGGDRMVYTIQNAIKEDPSIDYNDGALKMILYTKGKVGNASKELQDMLKYFESSTMDNVTNSDIEFMHHMVDRIKEQKEMKLEYMKAWEWDEYNQNIGREEGLEQGRKEGREQGLVAGREEGLVAGREEGLVAGREEGLVAGREEGLAIAREESIHNLILTCLKFRISSQNILNEIMSKYSLSEKEAQSYLDKYSNQS